MIWMMTILFLILTIVFLMGKGGFLIAGYNTASAKEKARYDEKKMCRVMGVSMGIITVMMGIWAYLGSDAPGGFVYAFLIVTLVDVVVTMILTNTICKRKEPLEVTVTPEDAKKNRRIIWGCVIFTVVLSAAIGIWLVTGDIKINFDQDGMEIQASYWQDKAVTWDEIQRVEYLESMDLGRRTNGFGGIKLKEGHYENESLGKYLLYSYGKCETYVVLETETGILALNQESQEQTKELYEKIQSQLD